MKIFNIKELNDGRTALNLGCGGNYYNDWNNINLNSVDKDNVIQWDLRKGIPYKDNSFDVVYSSHFLEHVDFVIAKYLLKEIYRVLKPNSNFRLVVPNLERTINEYVDIINKENIDKTKYKWILFELLDQFVRINDKGYMANFVQTNKELSYENYFHERFGIKNVNRLKNKKKIKIKSKGLSLKFKITRLFMYVFWGGKLSQSFYENFKNYYLGELHRWFYDSYQLTYILQDIGFIKIETVDAFKSKIFNWETFNLDLSDFANNKNEVYKPDSLYIEAKKK